MRKGPAKLYALLYDGAYGQTLHSMDYPNVFQSKAAMKKYVRREVPKVKWPVYRIAEFREVRG